MTAFTSSECMNDPDNLYFCSHCGTGVRSVKKITVARAPQNLLISLRRFEFNHYSGRVKKRMNVVNIGTLLSVESRSRPGAQLLPVIYTPYAVVMHAGTADGGHYYTYSLRDAHTWLLHDDSHICSTNWRPWHQIEEPGMEGTAQPYILFYRRI